MKFLLKVWLAILALPLVIYGLELTAFLAINQPQMFLATLSGFALIWGLFTPQGRRVAWGLGWGRREDRRMPPLPPSARRMS